MLSRQPYLAALAPFILQAALVSCVESSTGIITDLTDAPSHLDRLTVLPEDSDWAYDFTAQDRWTFEPGSVVNANRETFPAVAGYGMSMAMLNLGPCSMLPPHHHPRATNFVVAVSGSTDTYMVMENGARTVKTTLVPGKMTIFPSASVHWMQNTGCENAQLVSALDSEDPGTLNLANTLFSVPPSLLSAALGYTSVDMNTTRSSIPEVGTGSIYGPRECIERCAREKARKARRAKA